MVARPVKLTVAPGGHMQGYSHRHINAIAEAHVRTSRQPLSCLKWEKNRGRGGMAPGGHMREHLDNNDTLP